MAQQNTAASGNLNSNNGSARPDSVDMAEAVALMADAGDAGDDEPEETASADEDAGDDAPAEDDGKELEAAEEAADEESEAAAEDVEAPEFWSAEDKAAWKDVPAELRPILEKYEQQRIAFVNEKTREAAHPRGQRRGPARRRRRTGGRVVAAERPGIPAGLRRQVVAGRLEQARREESGRMDAAEPEPQTRRPSCRSRTAVVRPTCAVARARRAGLPGGQAYRARQAGGQATRLLRHAGHGHRTYDELGDYLFRQGHPGRSHQRHPRGADHRAGLDAMRFEQAQKQAPALRSSEGTVTGKWPANTTAKTTPTRVAPGPAGRIGNRNVDAARQVGERFRRSGGARSPMRPN